MPSLDVALQLDGHTEAGRASSGFRETQRTTMHLQHRGDGLPHRAASAPIPENGTVHYDEGLLVGYRWLRRPRTWSLFPLRLRSQLHHFHLRQPEGDRRWQFHRCRGMPRSPLGRSRRGRSRAIYVQPKLPQRSAPVKELKGFAKINLKPVRRRRSGFAERPFLSPTTPPEKGLGGRGGRIRQSSWERPPAISACRELYAGRYELVQ